MKNKSNWNFDNATKIKRQKCVKFEHDISDWNFTPLKRNLARGVVRRLSNIEKGKPTTPLNNISHWIENLLTNPNNKGNDE